MDDPDLTAIREARLKQLRQNASSGQTSSPLPQGLGGGGGEGGPEAAAKQAAQEQMRREQLAVLLEPQARERRKFVRWLSRRMIL